MLVLTREQDEEIVIDNRIVVTIVRIGSKAVRVGVVAPKSVKVVRSELDPGKAEQIKAAIKELA